MNLAVDFVTRYFRPLMLPPYTDCSTAIALRVPCRLKKRALLIAVSGQKSGDSIEGQPPATGALRSHQDAYILRDVLMSETLSTTVGALMAISDDVRDPIVMVCREVRVCR